VYSQVLNATDQRYADIAASTYNGVSSRAADSEDTYTVGAPRTYVLGLRYHFGE
jgi:iron complex outermembrane receptor protein